MDSILKRRIKLTLKDILSEVKHVAVCINCKKKVNLARTLHIINFELFSIKEKYPVKVYSVCPDCINLLDYYRRKSRRLTWKYVHDFAQIMYDRENQARVNYTITIIDT